MGTNKIMRQVGILFALVLANFMAQIPYFFHLYYRSQPLFISMRSFLVLGFVFAFFLAASFLLFYRQRIGYFLMVAFLSVEFLFYLWGLVGSTLHGYMLFFQLNNPDLLLRIVYSIGYLNFFASGYFLYLILRHRNFFIDGSFQSRKTA